MQRNTKAMSSQPTSHLIQIGKKKAAKLIGQFQQSDQRSNTKKRYQQIYQYYLILFLEKIKHATILKLFKNRQCPCLEIKNV